MEEIKKEIVRTTIYMPKKLHKEFKLFCTKNDSTVTKMLVDAINKMMYPDEITIFGDGYKNRTLL